MANNDRKQDFKDSENLIKETNEKHNYGREQNSKTIEEIKMMISGTALQNTEVASHSQSQIAGNGNEILGPCWNSSNTSDYTKLDFPRFDGSGLHERLYKVEQSFDIDHTLELNKVKLVSIHLDEKALHW